MEGQDFSGGEEDEECQGEEQDQQQPPGTGPYATLHNEGPQTSAGSAGHPEECMPCTFYCFTRRGCNRGLDCRFCHLTHQSKLQQRREAWKKQQREKRKSIRERVAAETSGRRISGGGGGRGGHSMLEVSDGPGGGGSFKAGNNNAVGSHNGGARSPGGMNRRQAEAAPSLSDATALPSTGAVFTYVPGRAILTIGQDVEFRPKLTARASGFRLSMPLPHGLALDPMSGIIFGTPLSPAAKTTVVVEANVGGRSAHAVLDLEVVDFTRGGFVVGHLSEPEPGKFMMLLYIPEGEQAGNEALQDTSNRARGGRALPPRRNGAAPKQKGTNVDAAAAMRAMGLQSAGGWGVEAPKSAVAAAAAATPLEWW